MIKNTDLESLYNKINGRIELIGSALEDDILPKIMKSCRLKPYSIFSGTFQSRKVFETYWVDEFGNSLIIENKKLKILMNDTQINKNTRISTDLFFANNIDDIAKNSKCALIINGVAENNCYFVAFYGKDDYLRVFFCNKELVRVSPLLLGMNTLRDYYKNIHTVFRNNLDKNKLDLLLKFDVVDCMICWEPPGWKDHIKGECL